MTTSVKTCFKCEIEKPITSFYKHPEMADGRLNKCKSCAKVDVSENYHKRRDYYRAYDLKRAQRPERKAKQREYGRAQREHSPEKWVARYTLGNAVRDGRVIRPDVCSKCGGNETRIEAHHHDYSKPLDVEWLCFACHRAEHGQEAA